MVGQRTLNPLGVGSNPTTPSLESEIVTGDYTLLLTSVWGLSPRGSSPPLSAERSINERER